MRKAILLARRIALPIFLFLSIAVSSFPQEEPIQVGVAAIDITPDYPVRLNGFGGRRTESEGVTQPIFAKALVFSDEEQGPAVLITADNLGVSLEIVQEVAARLRSKIKLKPERLTITATHTHTAPMLKGVSPTVFGVPIPPEHQANIERYTREFVDKLEQVALVAVKDIKPARLAWGIGSVGFAANRRTKGGPVDHDLPVFMVQDLQGNARAVYFSYACHCVTLSDNKISGDWAGFAQVAVQKAFPGSVALASIGCGADANPTSGLSGSAVEKCADQGRQIADEIKRLMPALKPVAAKPAIHFEQIDIPFDAPRTRAEWEERAKSGDYAVAYHAKLNLERLDRNEPLPTKMTYIIQSWIFDEELAMFFLPGETVVDYSLRLKREFDRNRLWINGYSNEERCYVPSERILKEGGYEGGAAMIYYDRPQRFAAGLEQRIIDVVHGQIPKPFLAPKGTEGIAPLSPKASLKSIRTKPSLEVELVASEPEVVDPVAIDWGADGKLWVCEMNDYPTGMDGNWQPGGRIKFLEDTDGNGHYDKATLFVENVPFPTGVTAWGKGAFICAAPDLLYAEDTNGDGKADKIQKVFTGFSTENYQARLNSLSIGLDNWIYGANGLLGGTIRGVSTRLGENAASETTAEVNVRNRDFRFNPFNGAFEAVSGLTQYGRVRDDWGNWFGCNNSEFLIHFPYGERYAQRNPAVAMPAANVSLPSGNDTARIHPISRLQERYNDLDNANRATSAGGLGLYRDTLLGEEYHGNAFTGETVHNIVHREVISGDGVQFTSRRPADEQQSEFFASSDNWFRPAQIRTGPDGALYIVDMYRFLIEHPRWIAAKRLAEIDVRAGADKGRIYRVKPRDKSLRPIRNLRAMSSAEVAAAMDSPNGTERDRVQVELLTRRDSSALPTLYRLASEASLPQVRVQALSAIEGLGTLTEESLLKALGDSDPRVRQNGLRLSEPILAKSPSETLARSILALTNDTTPVVLHQLAYTLGEWNDSRAGQALVTLARAHLNNPDLRLKILTSASRFAGELLAAVGQSPAARKDWAPPLLATIAGSGDESALRKAFTTILPTNSPAGPEDFGALAVLLDGAAKRNVDPGALHSLHPGLVATFNEARRIALDNNRAETDREAAFKLLTRAPESKEDIAPLAQIAAASPSKKLRAAALAVLRQRREPLVAVELLTRWPQASPTIRFELLPILLQRVEWTEALLRAIKNGSVQPNEIAPSDRQRIAQSGSPEIRELAASLFVTVSSGERETVLKKYADLKAGEGQIPAGREVFLQQCASCHALNGIGHAVGPDLAPLRDKDTDYFLKNILNPNAVIEPRFVAYNVELKDDRSILGLIKSEDATGLSLILGGGQTENIGRSEIKEIRASNLSLMPEGIEQAISPPQMADLIAFMKSAGSSGAKRAPGSDIVLRDPASVARFVLDDPQPGNLRESAITTNPQFAGALIAELTRDLIPGTPEEYRRIPWIWRVAIASGKRNEADQIKRILEVSLPNDKEPLRDWQAVVIGGGIINGISQRGQWPRVRLLEIIGNDRGLKERWERTRDLAATMADDAKVPSGTRYDALRMLGGEEWDERGAQLVRYLSDKNSELQMGAVSGLADVDSPEATRALINSFSGLTKENRKLAVAGLLRGPERKRALVDAITSNMIASSELSASQMDELK